MANYNTVSCLGGISQGNVTSETAFASAQGGAVRGLVGIPSSPVFTGQASKKIILRAAALVTGGTTTNYTLAIRANLGGNTNLTTFTSDTAFMTTPATAVNSATRSMIIDGYFYWDATSQRAIGAFSCLTDVVGGSPTFTAWAIGSNPLTGVASITTLQFLVTGLFSATNANNAAVLTEFAVDIV